VFILASEFCMSAFDALKSQLARYRALEHHHNPILAAQLIAVQTWQKARMQHTHRELFAQPEHQLMAAYFLNRLYGGADFAILADQFERVILKAHKVEKIAPASAVHTGTLGIELAVLAIELDEQLAKLLLTQPSAPINDDTMLKAYLDADQAAARQHQMALLNELGLKLDKYVRSLMIQTAFKLAKGTAYKHDFAPVYDFTAEGFAAMKSLDSAAGFIETFTQAECEIIQRVHSQQPDPFRRAAVTEPTL
jgi:hypothetical protein